MVMEIPAKALLVIEGTSNRAMAPGVRSIQAMQKALSGLPVTVDRAQSETIRVQCNPFPPSIRAYAQSTKVDSMQKPGGTTGTRWEEEFLSIESSVELVFITVNSKNASITDKFRLSADDVVSNDVATAKAVNGGRTIRPQTDGPMGVVIDMDTRGVASVWQDMVSEGQVSSLRNSYNMFNMLENPISGSIDMSITQNISEAFVAAWNKALDKCFTSGMAGKNPLEKVGNLTNLNL